MRLVRGLSMSCLISHLIILGAISCNDSKIVLDFSSNAPSLPRKSSPTHYAYMFYVNDQLNCFEIATMKRIRN